MQRDTLYSLLATAISFIVSGGIVYLYYLTRVTRTAKSTPLIEPKNAVLMVFGKRLLEGQPDDDFSKRIEAAHRALNAHASLQAILLGGGEQGQTEGEVARQALLNLNASLAPRLHLETQSMNTLENVRNCRALLVKFGKPSVVLLSNRYHLARCAQFAGQLGLDFELYPAEERFEWNGKTILAVLREAFCLAWLDIGTRWARLIGHKRMLNRVV